MTNPLATADSKPKALLISAYLNSKEQKTCEEHLDELALLTYTYGAEVIEKVPCFIRKTDSATFLTSGKVEELVSRSQELGVDLIIIDDEIAPSQQRNLEKIFGKRVMDRVELILEVFAARAETKEARLQIQLAKVKYEAPRLKRLWTHLSRQQGSAGGGSGGGGGYLKGEGEKQIEIDRRILKKKIDQLQTEIADVKKNREILRNSREKSQIPVFAIVGYTNVGKSTLLNALTGAQVFVEDKLFATLDTTTRKFTLPTNQEILLVDTVGFIRKLPHLLVASFKSTLEEALYADILLHLVDISHPAAFEHAKTTTAVLKELGADRQPVIHILNKIDLVPDRSRIMQFKLLYPNTIEISALTGIGKEGLVQKMVEELSKKRSLVTFRIPQSEYGIVSEVMQQGYVAKVEYEENDVVITAEVSEANLGRFKSYINKENG